MVCDLLMTNLLINKHERERERTKECLLEEEEEEKIARGCSHRMGGHANEICNREEEGNCAGNIL